MFTARRFRVVLAIAVLLTFISSITPAYAANTTPPVVTFQQPANGSTVMGTISIQVQACANPSSDTIVAMQVRFAPPSGPSTSWRAMTFTEGTGCVVGTYSWNSNEFGDGPVGIDARAADYNGSTKYSNPTTISVVGNNGGSQPTATPTRTPTAGPTPTRTPTPTPAPLTYPGNRAMFVWDESIPGNNTKTTTLINFAASRSIDDIYISAHRLGLLQTGAVTDYTSFVNQVHGAGLKVYGLDGNPWWGVACNSGIAGQTACFTDGWNVYANIYNSGIAFNGFIDDTAPYVANTDDWWANTATRAQMLLDFQNGVRSRTDSIFYIATIPFWYDEDPRTSSLKLNGSHQNHPLNWYISMIVNQVAIMDYRDTAEGPNGIIAHATGELGVGPTIIGVETQNLGPTDEAQTFWEEGNAYMEGELQKVYNADSTDPQFVGFFIHQYDSYKILAP